MNGAWETLKYRDFQYLPCATNVRETDDGYVTDSALTVRGLVTHSGERLVQKLVRRPDGLANPELYDLLDREIRAGARLLRRFPGDAYPAELSKLVGYDIDGEEPFVLLEHYLGEPVAARAGRLLTNDQHSFEVGLFRALRYLEAAKLVHGGLSPDSIRWEDGRTQVAGFEQAVLVGEPRVRGASRWCSPEQRDGKGGSAARDDVWSAGAIVLEVVTGQQTGTPPDPGRSGPALAALLAGIFDPGENRPSASDVLHRLTASPVVPARQDDTATRFSESRQRFDEVLTGKKDGSQRKPLSATGGPRPGRLWFLLVSLVIAAAVVAGLVWRMIG
ncbi:hypothetical protein ACFWNN_42500 [Lentzea sp. NPDC058450]|uniref:hypothetical protein n=1 Tax=Lentzea sp. NPDC058450 TaxID=3346505 RepID=UPI003664294C